MPTLIPRKAIKDLVKYEIDPAMKAMGDPEYVSGILEYDYIGYRDYTNARLAEEYEMVMDVDSVKVTGK